MKISIIYHSETGNTKKVAGWIKAGAAEVPQTEVAMFNLKDEDRLDQDFIEDSAAVIFGTPTYFANMSWQMKKWLDMSRNYKLAGKIGAVFATENFSHGGGELAMTAIMHQLLVKGMLLYSGGSSCGQPFIHIGPTVVKEQIEEREEVCRIFGQRIAKKAHELFNEKK